MLRVIQIGLVNGVELKESLWEKLKGKIFRTKDAENVYAALNWFAW